MKTSDPVWRKTLERWLVPRPRIAEEMTTASPQASPGMYAFRRPTRDGFRRLFLRVDESGAGVLIADASEALRLSPVGCYVAQSLLEGVSHESIRERMNVEQAGMLVADVQRTIDSLGRPDRRYPALSLVDPLEQEGSFRWLEPLQADVEVGTDSAAMRRRIDWLSSARIPHVRFLLRDDSPRESLVDLVEFAEDRGLITGVRLSAQEAAASAEVDRWIAVGLDYLILPIGLTEASHRRAFGDDDYAALEPAVRRTRDGEIAAVLEIGLTSASFDAFEPAVERGAKLGGNFIEAYAIVGDRASGDAGDASANGDRAFEAGELPQLAAFVEDVSASGMTPISFLPPVYVGANPIDAALKRGPRTAGDLGLLIDAAGNIYLPRGSRTPIGTTRDDWSALRSRPAFEAFRERLSRVEFCDVCPRLAICTATCPAHRDGWADES